MPFRKGIGSWGVLVALLVMSACAQEFSLRPPAGEPITVSDITTHSIRTLSAGDAPYQRLAVWAEQNRTGWSSYGGSPPSSGTMVIYGNVSLQFVDGQVLARAPGGIYTRSVPENMAAMLQ